jgi:hypothetical protein
VVRPALSPESDASAELNKLKGSEAVLPGMTWTVLLLLLLLLCCVEIRLCRHCHEE